MLTNSTLTCPLCGLTHDRELDGADHHDECALMRYTCQRLDYRLNLETHREERKIRGSNLRRDVSQAVPDRARGWEMTFDAHFERSLRHAVRCGLPQHHPKYCDYVAMRLRHEDPRDPLIAHLIGIYGVQDGMEAGSSYFETRRVR